MNNEKWINRYGDIMSIWTMELMLTLMVLRNTLYNLYYIIFLCNEPKLSNSYCESIIN